MGPLSARHPTRHDGDTFRHAAGLCRARADPLCRPTRWGVVAVMGRQHCTCGLIAGMALAGAVPAPGPVRLLAVAVTGGAALLPDLDHPQATAARSLGVVTRVLAHGVDRLSLAVYYATRGERDPADRHSGHRLLTHTAAGCLGAGVCVALAGLLLPVTLIAVAGLLGGLLALGLRFAGPPLAVSSAGLAWLALSQHPGWWWAIPVCIIVGTIVHILGDMVTNSGAPLLWPYGPPGRAWVLRKTPVTFPAGGAEETYVVAPLLWVACLLTAGWATGLLPLLWETWTTTRTGGG